jgi:hypothetical protein
MSEQPSRRRASPRRFGRTRTWLASAVVVALGAIVTSVASGAFDAATGYVRDLFDGGAPVEAVAVDPPLRWSKAAGASLPSYVLPARVDDLAAPPADFEERERWARDRDGADAFSTDVQVVVTAKSERSVILQDLVVRVVQRRPPMTGTHVTYGPGGEGVFVRWLRVDLDQEPPAIKSLDERPEVLLEGTEPAKPIRFPYRVTATEPEVFHITAITKTCFCQWIAELRFVAGGEEGRVVIDDDGRPFRTTSIGRAVSYQSTDGQTYQRDPRF